MVDVVGSFSIATLGHPNTGVSTDIHVNYLRGAKAGEVLEAMGRCDRMGRNMGMYI